MTRALLALFAILAAACTAILPTATPTPASTHDIVVQLTLVSSDHSGIGLSGDGKTCYGKGGYSDIQAGAQFTIKDAAGTTVGFGSFTTVTGSGTACTFSGTAKGVPDLPIYALEAGRRGSVNFTRDDLTSMSWTARLSIGN